jgi:hypothetical protein
MTTRFKKKRKRYKEEEKVACKYFYVEFIIHICTYEYAFSKNLVEKNYDAIYDSEICIETVEL